MRRWLQPAAGDVQQLTAWCNRDPDHQEKEENQRLQPAEVVPVPVPGGGEETGVPGGPARRRDPS